MKGSAAISGITRPAPMPRPATPSLKASANGLSLCKATCLGLGLHVLTMPAAAVLNQASAMVSPASVSRNAPESRDHFLQPIGARVSHDAAGIFSPLDRLNSLEQHLAGAG